jgi:hypothetical protein
MGHMGLLVLFRRSLHALNGDRAIGITAEPISGASL